MFRFFENLVDPYCDYPEQDRPPTRLWPFMKLKKAVDLPPPFLLCGGLWISSASLAGFRQ